ncbi:MAG: DUF1963 domain-containing protein, partial [Oscillospiraceae bacterium]|nr:DUF1963 domain-containing protein [Oscillospiraceae bacterium]
GGLGYIPHDKNFPCDSEGNQLRLLAQIDCSQVDFKNFPKLGLLQFWILNDKIYGDDIKKQGGFRVIYYSESEIDRTVTEQEVILKFVKNNYDEDAIFPVRKEFGMCFTFGNSINFDELDEEEHEEVIEDFEDVHHQIGGYPFFIQFDPREENSKYDFLLFQLDSEYAQGTDWKVIWGDTGVCYFFISSEDLKKLDFSDVLYTWDCC